MLINVDRLQKVFPKTKAAQLQVVADALVPVTEKYGIQTPERTAMFIAQAGVESANFTKFIENLNYSAQGLLATFPTHFTAAEANTYARNPEKIANRAYANRMGNGDESSGDGWKFRGRGAIMITGRSSYTLLGQAIHKSVDDTATHLETLQGALEGTGWWWNNNHMNGISDQEDVLLATKRVNGGTNGLEDRKALYAKARQVFI